MTKRCTVCGLPKGDPVHHPSAEGLVASSAKGSKPIEAHEFEVRP